MTKADEHILKTDRLGRVQTPVARREQLLDEFAQSGLSGMKFAALVGIKYTTFAAWRKRRREHSGNGSQATQAADSMRWLEAVVEQAQHSGDQNASGLVVELPGGARARIGNGNQAVLAAALVRALEKSC